LYARKGKCHGYGGSGVIDGRLEDVVVVVSVVVVWIVDGGGRAADAGDMEERIEGGVVSAVGDGGVYGRGWKCMCEFVVGKKLW